MSIKTPGIAGILTSDFIKLRVSNAIHVTGYKTSLLWASKMHNMYRFSCKRRTPFCNNTTSLCNDVLFPSYYYKPRNLIADGICTKECGQFSRNDTCHHLEFCRFFKLQYKRPDSSQWCLFKAHFFFRRRRNRANVDTTNAPGEMKNQRYSKWGREWGDYRVHKRCVIGDVSLIEFIGRYPYCQYQIISREGYYGVGERLFEWGAFKSLKYLVFKNNLA